MDAAGQVKDVYKDIELEEEVYYGSNIREFTKEQCREAVSLLGNAGFVSVTEDTNMENYEEIEDFYAAYMEKRDAMVTIYEVKHDETTGCRHIMWGLAGRRAAYRRLRIPWSAI